MIRFLAIIPIKIYQHVISPKKGFRCAYSVKNGGSGCSGAVIEIIENASIFEWRRLIKKRFSECKKASEELKKEKKSEKCYKCQKRDFCDAGLDCADPMDCDCGDIGGCSL